MDKNSLRKKPIGFSGNILIQELLQHFELINKMTRKSSCFHKDKNSHILWFLRYHLYERHSKISLKAVEIYLNEVYQLIS